MGNLKRALHRALAVTVAVTTTLWLMAPVFFAAPTYAATIVDGATITGPDGIDVWIVKLINGKMFKRLVLNPQVFNSYQHLSWNNIVHVSQAVLDSYKTSDAVRVDGDTKVWRLIPNGDTGEKRWITTADIFLGSSYDWDQIYTINSVDGGNYVAGADMTVAVPGLGTGTATTPTTPVGTGLTVALASDTPGAATLPDGSAYNKVTKLNLTAGSDGEVKVTGFRVTRAGFSLNSDFTGVMIFDANGKRHGNVVTLSDDKALITFTADPITIAAGQTSPVWIEVNIDAAQTTNGTFNFGIASAADVMTANSATVNGTFPLTGSTFAVINGANTLGAVDLDAVTISAAARNVDLGSKDYQIGKFKFYETSSKEDVKITSLTFYNNGNTTDDDLVNLKLKNDADGTILAEVAKTSGKYLTFVLTTPLTIAKGQNKTVVITADVVNGSTRTAQFILQNDYDVTVMGVSTGGGLLATHTTNLSGDATAGFPVGEAANYNTITVTQGSLTITKDNSSLSGNISQGQTGVVVGVWKLEAIGEDIEIQKADLEVGGTTVAADFSGSVSLQIDGTTIYSISDLTTLLNGTVDGTDQKTLSSYYTIPSGTSKLAKMVLNVNSSATNGRTIIGQLGDIYYKRTATNNFTTASDNTLISANTLTITTATLTVAKNAAYGDQNVVGGGANTKIGSFLFQAGSAEGVNVSAINVDMSAVTGMTNMRLKKVNSDGTETQIGSTVSTPSTTDDANSFSVGGTLNIAASGTVVVNVYVDMSSSAVTVNTDIDAADVTASGSSSGTSLTGNIPASQVTGQTITLRASGTLLVETDPSTPVEAVIHSLEADRELLRIKFTSQYEAINITKLILGSRRGNANLSAVSLTYGSTTVTTVPINGVATFTGLSMTVPKDSTLIVLAKGTFTNSGTLVSAEEVRLGIEGLEATGVSSGNRVYEMSIATSASAGDIAADTATNLTVTSTVGFGVGDVVEVHTAQAVSAFTGVVTSIGGATTLGVTGPQNLANCATVACFVTKWATREAVTSKTTAATITDATATAIDVSSTRGFATGDVVRIEGTTGITDDGGFYTVTAVTDGDTLSIIGVGEVTASPTWGTAATDRMTRMATTTSTQVRVASALTRNTASALEVNSTVGFSAGDVIMVNSDTTPTGSSPIYTVAAVTDADTLSVIGNPATHTVAVNSWVTELASQRTTTTTVATEDITVDTASVITVTSTAGFAAGDIVVLNSASTTQTAATGVPSVYMVTAVPSSTTITLLGGKAQTDIPASSYLTQMASSTGNGKPYVVNDVEPVITLNPSSPGASGTVSGSSNQLVALYDIVASGDVNLTIKSLTLTRGGNVGTRVATTAAPKVYDYTSGSQGALLGTGADWSGTTAGSTSLVTLDTPYQITATQKLTIGVTVNTASAIANDTFQVYVDSTGGLAGLFGGLSWYYVAISPSPGTEPTNASPSTLADTYPVYGNTLRY